jgi:hypothetical protein
MPSISFIFWMIFLSANTENSRFLHFSLAFACTAEGKSVILSGKPKQMKQL